MRDFGLPATAFLTAIFNRNLEVGPPINPVVRSSAPDPYGQDRVLLSGQRPHFFFSFAMWPRFCPQTLDS
jgi:hypothetical protein